MRKEIKKKLIELIAGLDAAIIQAVENPLLFADVPLQTLESNCADLIGFAESSYEEAGKLSREFTAGERASMKRFCGRCARRRGVYKCFWTRQRTSTPIAFHFLRRRVWPMACTANGVHRQRRAIWRWTAEKPGPVKTGPAKTGPMKARIGSKVDGNR